jgi:hypothetical protein
MTQIEDEIFSKYGMEGDKFKKYCKTRSPKLIRLRIATSEIESTLKAAFVGKMATGGTKIPPELNTDMLYQIYLCSREKHFRDKFQTMIECLETGMVLSGENPEYVKALNKGDDIQ